MSIPIGKQKVMKPVELEISAKILKHRHGKSARLLFDYLLAQTAMKYGIDEEGFIPVSQTKLESLGINSISRRRGLTALEELGLVDLHQEGHRAYRARLLYQAPKTSKPVKPGSRSRHQPDPPIDVDAYDILVNLSEPPN